MRDYFPKPTSFGVNVKVELYLSNYATKEDLKNSTGVDTLNFTKKTDLAYLKSDSINTTVSTKINEVKIEILVLLT